MLINGLTKSDRESLALFKVLSGSVRFRILVLLRMYPKGMTVGDISDVLSGSVSRISHQLSILKKAGLVYAE